MSLSSAVILTDAVVVQVVCDGTALTVGPVMSAHLAYTFMGFSPPAYFHTACAPLPVQYVPFTALPVESYIILPDASDHPSNLHPFFVITDDGTLFPCVESYVTPVFAGVELPPLEFHVIAYCFGDA